MKKWYRLIAGICMIMLLCAFEQLHNVEMVSAADTAAGITVTVPTDRAVYQRDCDNTADVTVTVNYPGKGIVEAQVLKEGEIECDWSMLSNTSGDEYSGCIPGVHGGGWYSLIVRARDEASGEEYAVAEVEHFGVGEVFITGGQSNSANFGGAKTSCTEDIVSAYDTQKGIWQHCEDSQPNYSGWGTFNNGGSAWPTLGDALVAELGVPVGFVSTGFGGSTIAELLTTHYQAIKDAVEGLKPYGCKAFLIHQGEADANTNRDTYKASYMELINTVRSDAGYDLPWVIAKVAYSWSGDNNTQRQKTLTDAQKAICNNYNIFEGPTTDDLQGDYRYTDNLHFSEKGLIEHGKRWADVLINKLYTRYNIKLSDNLEHGSFKQAGNGFLASQNIKLTAIPDDGYYLVKDSVKVNDGEFEVYDDTFTMPAQDVEVSAEFARLPQHLLDLGSLIRQAEAVDLSMYLDEGKEAFINAIAAARLIYADAYASESAAVGASAAINAAKVALVLKPVPVLPVSTAAPDAVQTDVQTSVVNPLAAQALLTILADDKTDAGLPKVGQRVVKGGIKYRITASTGKQKTVAVCGITSNSRTGKNKLVVPKAVRIAGYKYTVTAIDKKSFCKARKLKLLIIKSTAIGSVGKDAFKNGYKKMKIKVPAAKIAAYRKIFKGMNLLVIH